MLLDGTDCSAARYVKDAATARVSLTAFGAGGAAGGSGGRGIVNAGRSSFGKAVGTGVAGGVIGGLIVDARINSAEGDTYPVARIPDPAFIERLRTLATIKVVIQAASSDLAALGFHADPRAILT